MENIIIEFIDVDKYIKGRKILNNVSFAINEGEIFGLLGPNGAGKTTTIRVLLGLLKADRGKVMISGKNMTGEKRRINREIGFVLDKPGFYTKLSARQNLKIYAELYGVDMTEIDSRIDKMAAFFDLDRRLDDQYESYSKGMKQKVAIMRSLLHKPRILILDEVTSWLDPKVQYEIRTLIKELAKREKVTIIMSSHNLYEVEEICDSLIIIDKGEVKLAGKKEDIFKESGVALRLRISEHLEKALEIIEKNKDRYGVSNYYTDNDYLTINAEQEGELMELYKLLIKSDIDISSMNLEKASLENIYFDIVGREENDIREII